MNTNITHNEKVEAETVAATYAEGTPYTAAELLAGWRTEEGYEDEGIYWYLGRVLKQHGARDRRDYLTPLEDVVPGKHDRIYEFDANKKLASITIETGKHKRTGDARIEYATIHALLHVGLIDGESCLVAEYESHDGDATEGEIEWAVRCIEANSFEVI